MNAQISEENMDLSENEQRATIVKKNFFGNKDKVIKYFKENHKL